MKELKARREELKITQQQLADQLGISRPQLSRYENGLREADESIIEKWKGILFGYESLELDFSDYMYVREDLEIDNLCGRFRLSDKMKREDYLKMKECEDFSFDRLVDLARKGFKDGVVSYYGQSLSSVTIEANGEKRRFNSHFIKDGIEFIQSLYTEEFVIECEEDVLRINNDAVTTMQNGHVFNGNEFLEFSKIDGHVLYSILKGATVKQKKS